MGRRGGGEGKRVAATPSQVHTDQAALDRKRKSRRGSLGSRRREDGFGKPFRGTSGGERRGGLPFEAEAEARSRGKPGEGSLKTAIKSLALQSPVAAASAHDDHDAASAAADADGEKVLL